MLLQRDDFQLRPCAHDSSASGKPQNNLAIAHLWNSLQGGLLYRKFGHMKKLASMLALLLCTACATPPPRDNYLAQGRNISQDARNDLAFYALSLAGTPYRYGGNSPRIGFDCSGFVRYVFRHSLGVHLPRTVAGMSRVGRPVAFSQLRPGDLVFYDTEHSTYSHVGIYLGDNSFVHSPSNGKAVEVDQITGYWEDRYSGARRISLR
jgi:NlpC/P60 family